MMAQLVELREIRVFLALAKELHFARTAELLGITPSRVSQTIATFEARLGVRLFERTSRRVQLTAGGKRLADELGPVYGELEGILDRAAGIGAASGGVLRVGTYTRVVGGPYLLEIMERFASENPGWSATYIDVGTDRSYLESLRTGEIDVLAARLPISDPDFTVGPVLSREERVVLAGRGHPFAERAGVTLEDLVGTITSDGSSLPREMMDAFLPPFTPSGRLIPRVINQSIQQILISVAAGQQVHPTVPSFLDFFSDPRVVAVPLRGLDPTETALVWLTADTRPAVQAFATAAVNVITKHGGITLRAALPPEA